MMKKARKILSILLIALCTSWLMITVYPEYLLKSAQTAREKGHYCKAIVLYKIILINSETMWGAEHPNYLIALDSL